jgi:hypothetical protein
MGEGMVGDIVAKFKGVVASLLMKKECVCCCARGRQNRQYCITMFWVVAVAWWLFFFFFLGSGPLGRRCVVRRPSQTQVVRERVRRSEEEGKKTGRISAKRMKLMILRGAATTKE